MKFAGFWVRAGAAVIDGIILYTGFFVLELITSIPFYKALMEDFVEPIVDKNVILATAALWTLYFVVFVASKWQATPGKRLLKIYVITKEGSARLSFARSLGRELAAYISMLILCIGYIMAAFTKEKAALHDIIAKTRVIHGKV